MTPDKIVRYVFSKAKPERCPVCGDPPEGLDSYYVSDGYGHAVGVRIGLLCHGSYLSEIIRIDRDRPEQGRFLADQIFAFFDRAFKDEAASPDLRELIAYNRGNLPSAQGA